MAIRFPHLFEFMDLDALPGGFRNTMREILECGNAKPFRPYYDSAVAIIGELAELNGSQTIVELGAGTAPLTRRLAPKISDNITLSPCDANPDSETYQVLESLHPDTVKPIYDPVDFSRPHQWPRHTLLVLSGTLHHLPYEARAVALRSMATSADSVVVIEPLRKTALSVLFVFLSAVPALILPLWYINRPGRLSRFLWCWIIPAAPLAFLWDGWISCIRQWTDGEFRDRLAEIEGIHSEVRHEVFTQVVSTRRNDAP